MGAGGRGTPAPPAPGARCQGQGRQGAGGPHLPSREWRAEVGASRNMASREPCVSACPGWLRGSPAWSGARKCPVVSCPRKLVILYHSAISTHFRPFTFSVASPFCTLKEKSKGNARRCTGCSCCLPLKPKGNVTSPNPKEPED